MKKTKPAELHDIPAALQILSEFTARHCPDLQDSVLLQSAAWYDLQEEIRDGTVSDEHARMHKARLRKALLQIGRQAETETGREIKFNVHSGNENLKTEKTMAWNDFLDKVVTYAPALAPLATNILSNKLPEKLLTP